MAQNIRYYRTSPAVSYIGYFLFIEDAKVYSFSQIIDGFSGDQAFNSIYRDFLIIQSLMMYNEYKPNGKQPSLAERTTDHAFLSTV